MGSQQRRAERLQALGLNQQESWDAVVQGAFEEFRNAGDSFSDAIWPFEGGTESWADVEPAVQDVMGRLEDALIILKQLDKELERRRTLRWTPGGVL